jgi:hypothetical protein
MQLCYLFVLLGRLTVQYGLFNVAFLCKFIFEICNTHLMYVSFIDVFQEATYLWEDDDDRSVLLVYGFVLGSLLQNSCTAVSENLFEAW